MFDLDHATTQWQRSLASGGKLTQGELDELTAHLSEQVAELQETGLSEEESFLIASRRLGQADRLGEEFARANPLRIWGQRLLWAVLGIAGLLTAAIAVSTCLWLAEGGWQQAWANLAAFGRGLLAWPNPLLLGVGVAAALAGYRFMVCRFGPVYRRPFLLALGAMLAGQWAFQLAMAGSASMDASYSPKPFDQADNASLFTLMMTVLLPPIYCLMLWIKQRRAAKT